MDPFAGRPGTRIPRLMNAGLGILLLAWVSVARAADVLPPDPVLAQVGTYTALAFAVVGQGSFTYRVDAPAGWNVVTPSGRVTLTGNGVVFVTVMVPRDVVAGSLHSVRLMLLDSEGVEASAEGKVRVGAFAAVTLQQVPELSGDLTSPLTFQTTVTNRGNQRDRVLLKTAYASWRVGIEPASVVLEAGQHRTVNVTVTPTATVSNGYRNVFYLVATSTNDPTATVRVPVVSRWYAPGTRGERTASPRLVVSLDTGLQAGATLRSGIWDASLGYHVAPSVSGELSDYVSADATTDRLAGNLQQPFQNVPSGVSVGVEGPDWNASVDAYVGRYAVRTTFGVGDWDLQIGGRVVPSSGDTVYGLRLGGISRIPGLDLELGASTTARADHRTDTLSADYGVALSDAVDLGLGANVSGFAAGDNPYEVVAGVRQSLGWRDSDYEVQEVYSGVPQGGLHTVGLSGGWRYPYPYGVRASTSYSLSPYGNRWTNYLTLYGYPGYGLSLNVRGSYVRDQAAATPRADWTVSPGALWAFSLGGRAGGSVGVGYTHGDTLEGAGPTWDRYSASFGASYGGARLQASGYYRESTPYADTPPLWQLKGAIAAGYKLGFGTDLSVGYGYQQRRTDHLEVEDDIRAAWLQTYPSGVQSLLAYGRTLKPIEPSSLETVSVGVSVPNFLGQGFRLNAAYSLSSPTSVLDFDTAPTHRFSVGIAHTFTFGFDTPDALIQAFGGRRGAELSGTAYLDENMNGERDVGERGIAGVTLKAGPVETVTAADGTFRVRVPEGAYKLAFPDGLPATVQLEGAPDLAVKDNQDIARDLAFAPVASLPVTVFYDDNRNGVRDDGEEAIPYAGVAFAGSAVRKVQTSGEGTLLVSGLVPGEYTVRADASLLPEGFEPTGAAVHVSLAPGKTGSAIALGAAPRKRTVVKTFGAGKLAVLPQVRPMQVPRGGEVEILAFTQGQPDRVTASWGGEDVPLVPQNGRWHATVRVDPSTPTGSLPVKVRAEAGGERVERSVTLGVNNDPPFRASTVRAALGGSGAVDVEMLFKASEAHVVLPEGTVLTLRSEDGYHWNATWEAPGSAGTEEGTLVVDGREVGSVSFVAEPAKLGDDTHASVHGGGK